MEISRLRSANEQLHELERKKASEVERLREEVRV